MTQLFASAILLAAGRSIRMSAGRADATRKPFLKLGGLSVLEHGLRVFHAATSVSELILVGSEEDLERMQELVALCPWSEKVTSFVTGGEERTDSVRAGVQAITANSEVILIHDVARPLVLAERIDRCAAAALENGAALLAHPVRDTIKRSSDGKHAQETLLRSELWAAQTPQAFRARDFIDSLAQAQLEGFKPTDDAALYERYCGPVQLIEDSPENLKLTTPSDLVLAEAILHQRMQAAANSHSAG